MANDYASEFPSPVKTLIPAPIVGAGTVTDSQKDAELTAEGNKFAPGASGFVQKYDETLSSVTDKLIAMFPELQSVYDAYVKNDITEAKKLYYKTNFYMNMDDTQQKRALDKANRNGVYLKNLEDYIVTKRAQLVALGISDEKIVTNDFLEDSYLKGWTDKQLELNLLGKTVTSLTGGALGQTQQLKNYADAFGMSYNPLTYDIWTKSLVAGTMTTEDIQKKMRLDSASSYPVFAEQINAGRNLDELASAYKTSIANLLEKDPDTISWTDPNLRKALQNVDKDGKPTLVPIWQFEKNLRSTNEWEYTNNARQTMDDLSLKVLRDWGLA